MTITAVRNASVTVTRAIMRKSLINYLLDLLVVDEYIIAYIIKYVKSPKIGAGKLFRESAGGG